MRQTILSVSLTAALAAGAFAQSEIKERRDNQQQRIGNGIQSGQMTAGEAARAERNEVKINKEIAADRAANGGSLTNREKAQVNRQLDRTSAQIYNEKHNSATQKYGNNEVDARRKLQQQRIAQGVKSGQLRAGETAKLEGQESKINRQVRAERTANGGNLTNNQKAQANRELNRESGRIYDKKHNAAHQ